MNEPIDDKAFDEYLSRQSQVSRRYRELEALDVPPELDRRVLDRAAQAVEKKRGNRARVWNRWSVPVALAASTILAVAVVIESGVEPEAPLAQKAKVSDDARASFEPAPSTQPPAEQLEIQAETRVEPRADEAEKKIIEEVTSTMQRQRGVVMNSPTPVTVLEEEASESESEPQAPASGAQDRVTPAPISRVSSQRPAVPPPPPPPQAAAAREQGGASSDDRTASAQNSAVDLSEIAVTANRRRERGIIGPRGQLMRQGAPAQDESGTEEQRRQDDPALWLEFIRDLRRDLKTQQADREWSEFRKLYPEYEVAETDSARPQR